MITFETPGPVAPGVSAGYGAAEQFDRTLPTVASLYAQAAQMRQQQGLAQAQLNQQATQAGAERLFGQAAAQSRLQEQSGEAAGQLAERQAEYAASRAPSARDEYLAQQQQAELRQKAELQAWLSRQEISQAEEVRYQRQKNAIDDVMDPANGLLPHERQAELLRVKTGIDQFEERRKYQQVEHQKKQDQLIDDQIRRQAAHEQTNRDFQAEMLRQGKGVVEMVDDNGRRHFLLKNDKTGEWYNPVLSHGGGEGAGDKAAAHAEEKLNADYHNAFKEATAIVDKWAAATQKDKDGVAQPLYPEYRDQNTHKLTVLGKTMDLLGLERLPEQAIRPEAIVAALRQKRGLPSGQQPNAPGGAAGGGDFGTPGDSGGQPAQPAQPGFMTPQQAQAKFPPIPEGGKPGTPQQEQGLSMLESAKTRAAALDIPPAQKKAYLENADWAIRAFRTFGSPDAMPADVRDRFAKVKDAILGLPEPPKPDARSFKEKLDAGEAVTTKDVADALRRAGSGRLLDLPRTRARVAEAADKLNRGELVTTGDVRAFVNDVLMPAIRPPRR